MTVRGKIFPMGGAEVVHLVIHFVWKEQWSEVRIFRFIEYLDSWANGLEGKTRRSIIGGSFSVIPILQQKAFEGKFTERKSYSRWYASKYSTTGFLIGRVCHFSWCKYYHNGQFQATKMASMNVELVNGSWLQHTTVLLVPVFTC